MSNLRDDLRVGILGAAAGLFSIGIVLLIARIDSYYAYLSCLEETKYGMYDKRVEDLLWLPEAFWHLLLSIVASLMVHRYLTSLQRSPFLLWQVIGITSLLGWALTFFLVLSMQCLMNGNLSSFKYAVTPVEVSYLFKYVATAFACNVFSGSVIQASARKYTEQLHID